jgi:hypothetical protein
MSRLGLARLEALLEAQARIVTGFNVDNTFESATTISADATLARNSLNFVTDTGDSTYALPAAADCSAGDIIQVRYNVIIANTEVHSYGTAGEFYGAHSNVLASGNNANGSVMGIVTAPNGSSNDFLNLTGATDGGPGIGSRLDFWFDGDVWNVNGWLMGSGAGTTAVTAAFADAEAA